MGRAKQTTFRDDKNLSVFLWVLVSYLLIQLHLGCLANCCYLHPRLQLLHINSFYLCSFWIFNPTKKFSTIFFCSCPFLSCFVTKIKKKSLTRFKLSYVNKVLIIYFSGTKKVHEEYVSFKEIKLSLVKECTIWTIQVSKMLIYLYIFNPTGQYKVRIALGVWLS